MKKEWEQEGGRNTAFPLLKRVQFHAQYHWNTYCFSSNAHSWSCKNRKYVRPLKIIWKLFFILFFIFEKKKKKKKKPTKKFCNKYIKYTFDIRKIQQSFLCYNITIIDRNSFIFQRFEIRQEKERKKKEKRKTMTYTANICHIWSHKGWSSVLRISIINK